MKWSGRRSSENFEDRRGMSSGGKTIVGGGIIGIVILLLNVFGGENAQMLTPILEQMNQGQQGTPREQRDLTAKELEDQAFIKTLVADNEDVWSKIFKENNLQYKNPKLVLFQNAVETACGNATSDSGPFYCPGDQIVYMDLAFFEELKTKFGAQGGDFATAYVIAHEIGHHVQTLLAQAVGDDAIQAKIQGHIVPESFTHGTSAQRKAWFMKGYKTGDINQGDTFAEIR